MYFLGLGGRRPTLKAIINFNVRLKRLFILNVLARYHWESLTFIYNDHIYPSLEFVWSVPRRTCWNPSGGDTSQALSGVIVSGGLAAWTPEAELFFRQWKSVCVRPRGAFKTPPAPPQRVDLRTLSRWYAAKRYPRGSPKQPEPAIKMPRACSRNYRVGLDSSADVCFGSGTLFCQVLRCWNIVCLRCFGHF